jgi:hypothetical protein
LISANALTTAEVSSPAGENVGKLVDFMLDTERGSVVYGVLAVGGVLGVGAKMLAVPPESVSYDSDARCLKLAVDTATLADATGVDRANLPDHADAALLSRAPSSRDPSSRNQR